MNENRWNWHLSCRSILHCCTWNSGFSTMQDGPNSCAMNDHTKQFPSPGTLHGTKPVANNLLYNASSTSNCFSSTRSEERRADPQSYLPHPSRICWRASGTHELSWLRSLLPRPFGKRQRWHSQADSCAIAAWSDCLPATNQAASLLCISSST